MVQVETFPKTEIDQGEDRKQVILGGQRVTSFIKDVVAGRAMDVDGKRFGFNDRLIMEIYNRVCMAPGVKGFLRQTDSTTVGGEPVKGHYQDLPHKMQLFGRWLEEQVGILRQNPEDIIMALEIAASAHYGLTMPNFHPFDNGNGRTARALMNAILMTETYELTAFGLAIPPIPIIRGQKDEGHYVRALKAVDQTKSMNPFTTFIAQKWIDNLDERLDKIKDVSKKIRSKADKLLIDKLQNRRKLLRDFVNSKASYQTYPIPDYFAPKYVKVTHA